MMRKKRLHESSQLHFRLKLKVNFPQIFSHSRFSSFYFRSRWRARRICARCTEQFLITFFFYDRYFTTMKLLRGSNSISAWKLKPLTSRRGKQVEFPISKSLISIDNKCWDYLLCIFIHDLLSSHKKNIQIFQLFSLFFAVFIPFEKDLHEGKNLQFSHSFSLFLFDHDFDQQIQRSSTARTRSSKNTARDELFIVRNFNIFHLFCSSSVLLWDV